MWWVLRAPWPAASPALDHISAAPATAAPGLVASTLHLHGELAHEAHLLAALQRPSGQPRGVFLPRHCRLSRNAPSDDNSLPRGLAVDCAIDWIALQRPAAPL